MLQDEPMLTPCPGRVLITGGLGFIGSAVAKRISENGRSVRVVDIANPIGYASDPLVEVVVGDLRDPSVCQDVVRDCDEVMHFAADMGGMGIIHSANDFEIYRNNHRMTSNLLEAAHSAGVKIFFYASSACVYPPVPPNPSGALAEHDVWSSGKLPSPQGLYGQEKLDTELLLSHSASKFAIRLARFHNVYGPRGAWYSGREKAPAAFLRKALVIRKLLKANQGLQQVAFEIWGDGAQKRSFLYIDDCVDGILSLMHKHGSSYELVNIGSDRAVTIEDLARIAIEAAGVKISNVRFEYNDAGPRGVETRNSDNTFVRESLSWTPKVSLKEGMAKTAEWMSAELDLLVDDLQLDDCALQSLCRSKVVDFKGIVKFAILLPITSRGPGGLKTCLNHLHAFSSSIRKTCRHELSGLAASTSTAFSIWVFLLIDYDDHELLKTHDPSQGMNLAEYILRSADIPTITILSRHARGHICAMWRQCARQAYADIDNMDYFVLLGDDVKLETDGWMSTVHKAFGDIAEERKVPFGFGCVAFKDNSFPGMPTFPVMHRLHLDVFGGEVVPEEFINQDGDPYLFELYRRWGCSRMVQSMQLANAQGGEMEARYIKRSATGWKYDTLDRGIAVVSSWLDKQSLKQTPQTLLTIDVVIPSYRVDVPLLERILELKPPPTVSTMFVLIIDDPKAVKPVQRLKEKYGSRPDVRIRQHTENLGASAARNRGIEESSADWIVCLDDDIKPDADLLEKVAMNIRNNPNAAGFAGNVFFPPADTIYTSAIHLAGVTYFWNIAEKFEGKPVPWGVTANLIFRRNKGARVLFDTSFPKTGGGEDIDFCARKEDAASDFQFLPAPDVIVVHPWWNNGRRAYGRFYGWGLGDSGLVSKYPEFVYRDYTPNAAELLLCSTLLVLVGVGRLSLGIVILGIKLALSVVVANILHDIYRIYLELDVAQIPGRPGKRVIVKSVARLLAMVESTVIRVGSESGKVMGHLRDGNLRNMGLRFDWFMGKWGDGPQRNDRKNGMQRFVLMIALMWVF
ncbi:glycosyltransferase family 2 protein [Cylindrobasidium torrendii FP15055 ss-10]|uniref:Glycosyltransferase family 2 protein n=1 Tax=Cylindrobasidium torrendii FP15055 ss-10 TaxID=1314674 RepID=A0A0D7BHS0_9AGAR|nr:glycosyltransferase family 2 protein [Cylindrobasidium torrendii FP15055 ss-10]